MSQEAIKLTEKAGTSISKDKLLEAIRKSPNKQFTYSQCQSSKLVTVIVQLIWNCVLNQLPSVESVEKRSVYQSSLVMFERYAPTPMY